MEKDDHRPFIGHVMVNRDHLKPICPQRLENRRDFRFQHGDVACDGSVAFRCGNERRPSVQAHTRIDRRAHFGHLEIIPSDRDLVHRTRLFTHVTDNLSKLCRIERWARRVRRRCLCAFGRYTDQVERRFKAFG